MLDPSGNIHLTFRLPDDLLAFIHKKYRPFRRYEGQQKIKTSSILDPLPLLWSCHTLCSCAKFTTLMKETSQSKSGTGQSRQFLCCLELIEALLHLKLHLDNVLAFTEQMMTLTTTLTGLFWNLMCLPNRKNIGASKILAWILTPLKRYVGSRKFSEIWSKHFCESVEDGGTSYNGFVSTLHRCVPLSKEAYTKAQSRIKCLSFEMSLTCGQWPWGCQSDFKSKLEYLQVTRNFPRLSISHDCRFTLSLYCWANWI